MLFCGFSRALAARNRDGVPEHHRSLGLTDSGNSAGGRRGRIWNRARVQWQAGGYVVRKPPDARHGILGKPGSSEVCAPIDSQAWLNPEHQYNELIIACVSLVATASPKVS